MDSNNPYSNYQDFISSQGYYPNLDNIQNSEEFQNSDTDLNSQFSQNPTQSPISEDHHPPANISQNFLQNSQLPQTNTSNTPKAWTSQEDIMLMSSWCIISENPAIGIDQKSTRFWNGIWELYKRSGRDNNIPNFDIRTSEALRACYKRLNQNVTKWIGCYKEAYRRRKSGWSNDDIEDTAQKLYGRSKFSHKDIFVQVIRRHPNWEMDLSEDRTRSCVEDEDSVEEDRGSSKKSRTDGDDPTDSTPETPLSDVATIHHPVGRDKAKAKAKRKGKGKISQSYGVSDKFTSELRAIRISREKEVDAMTKLGDLRMKSTMLNTLMGKSNLSPDEEALKHRLMA